MFNRMFANVAAAVLARAAEFRERTGPLLRLRRRRPRPAAGHFAGYAPGFQYKAQARGFRHLQRMTKRAEAGKRLGRPPRHIAEKIELLRSGN